MPPNVASPTAMPEPNDATSKADPGQLQARVWCWCTITEELLKIPNRIHGRPWNYMLF